MSPSAPSGSGTESSSSDLRPITVMIVDDQRATRMGLSLIINRADDLQVTAEAVHGQDALDQLAALLEDHRPLPDVVLMDVRMPVLNGIDATARVTQLYPSIRTLVLTTYDEDDYAFGALEVGASGFLLKDVRAAQLAQAVRAVAQGDAVLTPRVTKELIARGVPRALSGAQREGLWERFGVLTPRELDVVRLIAEGMSNEEIAERLVLQPASVRRNVSRILAKLHLRDRVQIAVAWYKSAEWPESTTRSPV